MQIFAKSLVTLHLRQNLCNFVSCAIHVQDFVFIELLAINSTLSLCAKTSITPHIISILVNKSDKGMSDPVFTIPKEKKRRTAEKQEQEGQNFSVHIVVQLPQSDLDPALVLIEYCTGLGMFVVQRLFNQILHNA